MRRSLSPGGALTLAAVQPGFKVLSEAIFRRGDGAGVGSVIAWIWIPKNKHFMLINEPRVESQYMLKNPVCQHKHELSAVNLHKFRDLYLRER